MMSPFPLLSAILLSIFVIFCESHDAKLKVKNLSGKITELFWVNEAKSTEKRLFSLPINNEHNVDTFVGHKFRFKVENDESIKPIEFNVATHPHFGILIFNETSSSLDFVTEAEYDRQQSALKIDEIVKRSRRISTTKIVKDSVKSCADARADSDEYFKCVATGIKPRVTEIEKSSSETTTFRNSISTSLRNYTCKDTSLHTSPPVSTEVYSDPLYNNGKEMLVHTLLAKSDARVWMVDNFITVEESDILLNFGLPRLVRATVAGEDGTSVVSENRKAQQAVYESHTRNKDADPLWPLFKRILAITNHNTGYGLVEDGQEHFAIIQYNPTDEYTPHCDGSCDGMKHMKGGRVATAVMYLKSPDVGGGTIFTNTNLHIKPRNNTVIFFSYRGEDGTMDDNRYTEHSGCPVVEGEKWIATFWMREGVSKEDPWTNFDPNGRRMAPELSLDGTSGSGLNSGLFSDGNSEESSSLYQSYAAIIDRVLINYIHKTCLPVTDFLFGCIKYAFYSTDATAQVYDLIEDRYIRALSIVFPSNPGLMGSVLLTTVPVLSASLLLLVSMVVYLLGGFRSVVRGHRLVFRPMDKVGPDDYHRVVAGGLIDRTSSLPLADRLKAVEYEDVAALEEGRQLEDTVDDPIEGSKPLRRGAKASVGSSVDDSTADEPLRSKTPRKVPARRQGRTSGFANDESPFIAPAPARRARSKTPGSTRKRS